MGSSFQRIVVGYVAVFCCLSAVAVTPDAPAPHFLDIQKRNVFGLKDPEPDVKTAPPPKPLPKVLLTGITTVLGNKRALLKELPLGADGKTFDASKELLLILTEGQREADIEVLTIDEHKGAVRIVNSGTVMTLTFEKDGPQPPVSAPPTNQGIAAPATATASVNLPPGSRLPPAFSMTNANGLPLPVRSTRGVAPTTGGVLAPTGPVTTPPLPTVATQNQPNQGALTPEETQVLLEAQRQAMQYPTSNLPNAGSGTFTTPAQTGIVPGFPPPPEALPRRQLIQ